ncbi:hypothetical protein DH2020_043049 [Rehmannia glutinosa]|uniref:Fucosyltransferase n=1 Tax=Rehmannia glutinosa TaxID=99300 RepID=A0ABR0ULW6_REHGL
MKRFNKVATTPNGGGGQTMPASDHGNDVVSRVPEWKCGLNPMKLMGVFVVLVMGLSVLFSVSVVLRDPPSDVLWTVVQARNLDFKVQKAIRLESDLPQPVQVPKDKLLGDLLPTGFDEKSCLKVSWLLPLDFPLLNKFNGYNQKSDESYGNVLKRNSFGNLTGPALQPYAYLHLVHDYDDQDKLFFCDQDQTYLQKIPWLVMKTDNYFIPSLFLIPSFEQELHSLFPDKETVFHFLGRYLFHPTNSVWGLISRYYEAYLSKADVKVGIQIRVFDRENGPFKHVLDQILSCTMKEDILPKLNPHERIISPPKQKTVAVLITSLSSGYFEELRNLYWEYPTATGEIIAVYQPSHEGYQQTEKQNHNRKAWAEMYLLSLTDKLVTSSWSTFGYVAQGLGGLKPWILYKPENRTAPDPPCRRAVSMEPCFHAPPFYDCKMRRGVDTGDLVPHVKHCEDMSWGLKLVDH